MTSASRQPNTSDNVKRLSTTCYMPPESTSLPGTHSQLPFFGTDKARGPGAGACLTVALRGTARNRKQQGLQQEQRRVKAIGYEKLVEVQGKGILPPSLIVVSDVDRQIGVPGKH